MPTTLRSEKKNNDEIRLIHEGLPKGAYYLEMLRDDVVLARQEVAEASHPEMALEYYESLLPVWHSAR